MNKDVFIEDVRTTEKVDEKTGDAQAEITQTIAASPIDKATKKRAKRLLKSLKDDDAA